MTHKTKNYGGKSLWLIRFLTLVFLAVLVLTHAQFLQFLKATHNLKLMHHSAFHAVLVQTHAQ